MSGASSAQAATRSPVDNCTDHLTRDVTEVTRVDDFGRTGPVDPRRRGARLAVGSARGRGRRQGAGSGAGGIGVNRAGHRERRTRIRIARNRVDRLRLGSRRRLQRHRRALGVGRARIRVRIGLRLGRAGGGGVRDGHWCSSLARPAPRSAGAGGASTSTSTVCHASARGGAGAHTRVRRNSVRREGCCFAADPPGTPRARIRQRTAPAGRRGGVAQWQCPAAEAFHRIMIRTARHRPRPRVCR